MLRLLLFVVGATALESSWAAGATVTVIHDFGTELSPIAGPSASLLLGSDGNFYGTTVADGAFLAGAVFRVTHEGAVTVLYSFGSAPDDGRAPHGELVQAADGSLYGTTKSGGENSLAGTVFTISTLGVYQKLHDFGAFASDGTNPDAGLVQGPGGYLYGTTSFGGPYSDFDGTLYRISTTGEYSQLHALGATPEEGKWPLAALTVGSDGNLYGTTFLSGPREQPVLQTGAGTAFKFTPGGGVVALHDFGGADECPPDGASPEAALIEGPGSTFYGTTRDGGASDRGTIFQITPTGTLTLLYEFGSIAADGKEPASRLLRLADGTLLGTTRLGGAHESPDSYGGTAFMLAPDGTYTQLHSFGAVETDGQYVEAGLTRGTDGNFYGMTVTGGSTADRTNNFAGAGTVYRLVLDPVGTAPTTKYVPRGCEADDTGGGRMPLGLVLGVGLAVMIRKSALRTTRFATPARG